MESDEDVPYIPAKRDFGDAFETHSQASDEFAPLPRSDRVDASTLRDEEDEDVPYVHAERVVRPESSSVELRMTEEMAQASEETTEIFLLHDTVARDELLVSRGGAAGPEMTGTTHAIAEGEIGAAAQLAVEDDVAALHHETSLRDKDARRAAALVAAEGTAEAEAHVEQRERSEEELAAVQYELLLRDKQVAALREECDSLRSDLRAAMSSGDDSAVAATVAECSDRLAMSSELEPSLTGELAQSIGQLQLRQASQEAAPRSRRFSPLMKAFFGILLCVAGARAVGFVAEALGGPKVGTVLDWRQQAPKYMLGTTADAILHVSGTHTSCDHRCIACFSPSCPRFAIRAPRALVTVRVTEL